MSKLTDLLRQVERKDPQLAADLDREYKALSSRRAFGLNFERHHPESTEIPGRTVRKGDKVRILPPRGTVAAGSKTLWVVEAIERTDGQRLAQLAEYGVDDPEVRSANTDDLVVVSVFRDYIYPGLTCTGRVENGGDKPSHTVINGENFHALKTLTYTHAGKVDAIYIDPPYNTGSRDWKYNNDYVEDQDIYRHSKWLAFIERRLLMAKDLLNPVDSVLIITIDEKEYLRLGLLLEQTFPEARIQMVSTLINPAAVARSGYFGRSDEYYFFVMFGEAGARPLPLAEEWVTTEGRTHKGLIRWDLLRKSGSSPTRAGHPETFYPFFVYSDQPLIHSVGEPIGVGANRQDTIAPEGTYAVWPLRQNGSEGRWRLKPETVRKVLAEGCIRLGEHKGEVTPVYYLAEGERAKIVSGAYEVLGRRPDGSVITSEVEASVRLGVPGTQWRINSHDATQYGTRLLLKFMPDRKFPFPKSLYAVEDALRFFIKDKPDATVLDFFAGSGTTAHAVMRLNRQDGGRRQCISVTNNEVAADEQKALRLSGLRPGDSEWEQWGICDYITKPRLAAAISGRTPEGNVIAGEYKFADEFPMADGLEENAAFFTLTYETRTEVAYNKAFERIAPLLWLRAGAKGSCIDAEPLGGWELTDTYGVLVNLDDSTAFTEAISTSQSVAMAFIVTDDERRFQAMARRLPHGVEPVRLYESYLRNFQIRNGG